MILFATPENAVLLRQKLSEEANCGNIGEYSMCSFETKGTGKKNNIFIILIILFIFYFLFFILILFFFIFLFFILLFIIFYCFLIFYFLIGRYFAKKGTNPTVGESGKDNQSEEVKLETVFGSSSLSQVIATIKKYHTYEEPAYEIYKLESKKKKLLI